MNEIVRFEANGQEIELASSTVKDYLVNGNGKVTDQEALMFMELCKYQGLNPFLREAYLIKYSDKAPAQIVVGKDAFMKRAFSQADFERLEAGIIVDRNGQMLEVEGSFKLPKDGLLGGWARVYKKGLEEPVTTSKVSMQEYSKSQSTWKEMPATMIRKVAIVQALREAYPTELGAMYTSDELGIAEEEKSPQGQREEPRQAIKQTIDGDEVVEAEAEVVFDEEPSQKAQALSRLFNLVDEKKMPTATVQGLMEANYKKTKSQDLDLEEIEDLISVVGLWTKSKGI